MRWGVWTENLSLFWETLSKEGLDGSIIDSCQDKLMVSNENKVEILSLFLTSGTYPSLPKNVDKCPVVLPQLKNHSNPRDFPYIWNIEDLSKITQFNVINKPLLKRDKNALAWKTHSQMFWWEKLRRVWRAELCLGHFLSSGLCCFLSSLLSS